MVRIWHWHVFKLFNYGAAARNLFVSSLSAVHVLMPKNFKNFEKRRKCFSCQRRRSSYCCFKMSFIKSYFTMFSFYRKADCIIWMYLPMENFSTVRFLFLELREIFRDNNNNALMIKFKYEIPRRSRKKLFQLAVW